MKEASFAELAAQHRPRAVAAARAVVLDPDEAEDVAQEALLVAYLDLDRLRDPERFGAWLRAIATNLAKMRVRARSGWTTPAELEGGRAIAGPDLSLEDATVLRAAIDALPAAERELVRLRYVAGLSPHEIAELRRERPGTIRVRLHRARAHLREALEPAFPERRKEIPVVEVEIEDVIVRVLAADEAEEIPRLANRSLRIVLLRERGGERVLPIWIGAFEGDALALTRGGADTPRPLTPDLMARLVDALGGRVTRVTVTRLEDHTFYATVAIETAAGGAELDARPSDALNLAARVGTPIFVASEVMESAGRTPGRLDEELLRVPADEEGTGVWRSLSAELVQALWPKPKPGC